MPIPAGYAEFSVVLEASGDAEPYNVTIATQTALGTIPAETHCDRVFAAYRDAWAAIMWEGVSISHVVGRFGNDGPDPIIAESELRNAPGTNTGGFLPQNCAMLVRKVSGLGGRRNRGRSYIPFVLSESDVDNTGTILSGPLASRQTRADAFMASLLSADPGPALQPVILHRTGEALPTPFSTYVVESVLATQRRRLRR